MACWLASAKPGVYTVFWQIVRKAISLADTEISLHIVI